MLPSKLNEHCQTCLLKQNGYDSTHSLYPSYNYSTSVQSIKIGMHILYTVFNIYFLNLYLYFIIVVYYIIEIKIYFY